ncbi:hypothetical protein ACE1V3_00215 [Aeromonas veronii bv. sobria]|uniref:hypothetical protein n=1 Tax=Aeromonas veronii TaxID=654 RepID=UPI0035BF8497
MDVFTVLLVILLFPGVLFVIIIDNFIEHRPWDSWKYILYSIVSGVSAYFILQLIILLLQFIYDIKGYSNTDFYYLDVWNVINGSSKRFESREVIASGVVSILTALLFLKIKTTSAIHDLLIKLNLSEKYGDDPVFTKVIKSTADEYVIVMILDENITLSGRVYYYYVNEVGMQELGMIDVIATDMETGEELFLANKLYVSKPQGELLIYTASPELELDISKNAAHQVADEN